MFDQIPPDLRVAGPGIAGSALALFFLRRPPFVMLGIFLGGCLLSFFGSPWTAEYLGVSQKGEGLIGFLMGLFGMALVAKLHDTIEQINPMDFWKTIKDALRKWLGLGAE